MMRPFRGVIVLIALGLALSCVTPAAVHSGKPKIQTGSLTERTSVTLDRAGFIPKEASLIVTGDRVPAQYLRAQLKNVVDEKIVRKDGTKVELKVSGTKFPSELEPGQHIEIPIQAKISGKNYLTSKGTLNLSVENQPIVLDSISHLMVSNNPESFTSPVTLFKEQFPDNAPVRVFYHHYNKASTPYLFEMILLNRSNDLSRVHVIDGSAGPERREISVGAFAAERFFSAYKHRLGRIADLKPDSDYVLVRKLVNPGQCVSGIINLALLDGARPIVQAQVSSPGKASDPEILADANQNKSRGVFESPEITVDSEYNVGGDYAFMTLGKDFLLQDLQTAKPDLGNYGVFYTIHLALRNPTALQAPVRVMFSPQAGPARGIFLLNGISLLKTPVVSAFHPYPILEVLLQPGETRNVVIQTMPVGGSFYPVKIIAQP